MTDPDRVDLDEQIDWANALNEVRLLAKAAEQKVRREEFDEAHSMLNELLEKAEATSEEYPRYIHEHDKLATDGGRSETEISQTFQCECGGDVRLVNHLPMGTGESTHFRCVECAALGIRDIIPSPGGGERLRGVKRRAE